MKIVATDRPLSCWASIFLFFGSNMLFHFLPNAAPATWTDEQLLECAFDNPLHPHRWHFPGCARDPAAHRPLYPPGAHDPRRNRSSTSISLHILMAPGGLPVAALVTILWFLVFYQYRSAFHAPVRPDHAQ